MGNIIRAPHTRETSESQTAPKIIGSRLMHRDSEDGYVEQPIGLSNCSTRQGYLLQRNNVAYPSKSTQRVRMGVIAMGGNAQWAILLGRKGFLSISPMALHVFTGAIRKMFVTRWGGLELNAYLPTTGTSIETVRCARLENHG